MALTEISYPVTGTAGNYQNTFPSQMPIYAEFNRKDSVINTIVSGVDNVVRINISGTFTDIVEGQFVTFASDGYALTSAKVLSIVDASTIEVDVPFTSSNASNGFVNYFRNYFLELRFVEASSASNDQDAFEIIEDYSRIANAKSGSIVANLSVPSQLIMPDFEIQTGVAENLYQTFKIQFRESYDGNRAGAWVSPSDDIPIMLVHGTKDIPVGDFSDPDVTKRYVKGFPLVYTLVYSGINDSGSNELRIKMKQLSIAKTELKEDELATVLNLNGVYLLRVETSTFEEDTAFIDFSYTLSTSSAQYAPDQYDNSQYA